MGDEVPKAKKIWMNGEFVDWDAAKVHFVSHGLHYATGVFEGIRCYNTPKGPAIFRLKDHIERLLYGWSFFSKKLPYTRNQIEEACRELVRINNLKECYIRPLIYLGYGYMGLNPDPAPVEIGIAAWHWDAYFDNSREDNGTSLKISSFVRQYPSKLLDKKFSANYLQSALSKQEAVRAGFDDAVFINSDGFISECTGENIFMVKDKVLITPPANALLKGITRNTILSIAKDCKIKVSEKQISKKDLFDADEVFVTGTAAELAGVTKIGNKIIRGGKIGALTKQLKTKYSDVIHGKNPKYEKWLDYI